MGTAGLVGGRGKRRKRAFRAVIFDADGTLLDTLPLVTESWQLAVRRHFSKPISSARMVQELHGPQEDIYARVSRGRRNVTGHAPHEFLAHKQEHFDRKKHETWPFPDAARTLAFLKGRGAKLAVVTSSKREWMEGLLRKAGILGMLDVVVYFDTTRRTKPFPDPFVYAMKRLGVQPEETLAVGDAVSDITAARKAGCATAAIPRGAHSAADLRKEKPDYLFGDLSALRKRF